MRDHVSHVNFFFLQFGLNVKYIWLAQFAKKKQSLKNPDSQYHFTHPPFKISTPYMPK